MTLTDTSSTRWLLSLAAVGSLALTACGTTEVDDADADSDSDSEAGPVTVTDHAGEEITLDAPAQRVVTLEWVQTENVEMLGGTHVGVADLEGYEAWASAADVDEDIVDVGLRTEPSIEAIGQANPDLIIGAEESVPEGLLEDLQDIAPVVLQESADASDPLGHMERTFFQTAELLGAQDEAEQVWGDYEQNLEDARNRLSEADADGTPFVVVYPSVEGNTATFRLHGPGAMVSAIGEEIGLTPAWEEEGDAGWAISSSDTEGLTALPEDTEFFWWTASSEPEDPFAPLEDNSTWNSLGFVENDRMHAIERTWLYGGPGSAMQWTDQLSETVADDA
ncbi:iron-siderophore ABC transporter substrate-binding protein [Nesterenkonia xinjiangensis]|uniref:Iron complex transport system substrate-binding protein n=1 Tax=Nesterenkonia xinjiangensis TaxID=225327 RepID=A0A7Z0K830_9MICC|nr:iron-siderophore ABC transporter substrate-binding protein [Nesterenkonia xinjiangensis]NYJ77211.1 iron complex transport system substrate-binding protein [Nesterenkonia xinjiangensis]